MRYIGLHRPCPKPLEAQKPKTGHPKTPGLLLSKPNNAKSGVHQVQKESTCNLLVGPGLTKGKHDPRPEGGHLAGVPDHRVYANPWQKAVVGAWDEDS